MFAGVPDKVPALTVHRNCASGFEAITTASDRIKAGRGDVYLVGGTESMSNYPLLFPKTFSDWMASFMKAKTPAQKLSALTRFRLPMLQPQIGIVLGLTDYSCGLIMGKTAENLAIEFGISRKDQDEFALASHEKSMAQKEIRGEEIIPVPSPNNKNFIHEDNGVREGQTIENLEKLRPYFDRISGTVTVGNSSQLTDGAGAVLVMSEEKAKSLGYTPKAVLRDYAYAGLKPEVMGLGPVYSSAEVLKRTKLKLSDFHLIEMNEAFAAQVIACERAFASSKFAEANLGLSSDLGELDRSILNVNGGAIALGHPVGATGIRLVITMIEELRRRDQTLGLATLCIGGGQGGALVLERT